MVAERVEDRVRLACEVAQGMFSNELVIRVALPDGGHVTAFADRQDVISDHKVPEKGSVPGEVLVRVVAREGNRVWVDLPQQGFEGGPRIQVSASALR
jgi:hypothetical protein